MERQQNLPSQRLAEPKAIPRQRQCLAKGKISCLCLGSTYDRHAFA